MANPNWRQLFLRIMIIVAAGFWIYSPILNGTWLWDDDIDILFNPLLKNVAGLQTIWLDPAHLSAYYPITFTLEWIEWHLWGANTTGYHFVTLLFHILNGLLIWRLLSKLGLRLAWLGGLLFVVHPMNVESASWMVELKNTLSLTPFLLAMGAWIDFEDQRRTRDYWTSWVLFLVAMLCKTTAMMFPFVILLYAWWKHGRLGWKEIKFSLPFFPISFVLCVATTWLQHQHSTLTSDIPLGGALSRIACSGLTLSYYFSKFFLPLGLMPIQPQWKINPPTLPEFLPWLVVAFAFCWFWIKRASWGKHALLGFGFFLINLLPVLGFKLFSYMGFTWVFDHFLYIPMIGLIGLTIAAVEHLESLLPASRRPYVMATAVAALVLLMLQAHAYASIFLDQEKLWTYELKYNDMAWPAHDNLGNVFFAEGANDEAEGKADEKNGRLDEAKRKFDESRHEFDEANAHYKRSLAINPYRFEVHNNLGLVLSLRGHYAEAIEQYNECLSIKSDYALAYVNMGDTFTKMGRIQDAKHQYEQALKIDPDNGAARDGLSKLQ